MPTAALAPCSACKQVGCTEHIRAPWQSRARETKRITGRPLQRMRQALWDKEPACRTCGRILLPSQMIRDHIVPLAEGGPDTVENTQPLCPECSDTKTRAESIRGQHRVRQ